VQAERFDARGRFGQLAPTYDAVFTGSTGLRAINELELAVVTGRLGDVCGRRVLDAGMGTGRVAEALVGRGAEVVGIDVTPQMLERAHRRVPGAPRILARVGALLPFADRSFDDAVCIRVLKYVGDWPAALAEFRRVLRPGARLVVEIANRRSVARWGYAGYRSQPLSLATVGMTRRMLTDAGFLPWAVDSGTRLPHALYERSGERAAAVLDRVEQVAGRVLGDGVLARSFFVTAELVD
jgi:ubiquinone/menaquinone biosynthesis C-methylase UbiE